MKPASPEPARILVGVHTQPASIFINSVRGTRIPYSPLESLHWQAKLLGQLLYNGHTITKHPAVIVDYTSTVISTNQ